MNPLYKLFCTAEACSPAAQKIKGLSLSMTTKSGQKYFLQKGYLFKIFLHKKQSLVHKPNPNVTGRAVFSTESFPIRCYGTCTLDQHFSILNDVLVFFCFLKYSYNNFFGNWYPKLLRLPQKYHDTEGSLVFISIAKNGSRPYTQSLLFLICTLTGIYFFTLDDRSHNFARYDRAGAGRNRRALRVCCGPPWTST